MILRVRVQCTTSLYLDEISLQSLHLPLLHSSLRAIGENTCCGLEKKKELKGR